VFFLLLTISFLNYIHLVLTDYALQCPREAQKTPPYNPREGPKRRVYRRLGLGKYFFLFTFFLLLTISF